MHSRAMIVLVGEQPVPNLVAVRHARPERVVLVHTRQTEQIGARLTSLLAGEVEPLLVDPYDIGQILRVLKRLVQTWGWSGSDPRFNLTGVKRGMEFPTNDGIQLALRQLWCTHVMPHRVHVERPGLGDEESSTRNQQPTTACSQSA